MNYDVWVLIAQIAIPSLIALLAAYWQIRVAKEIANPKEKRPFFETRFGKFLKSYGVLILLFIGAMNSISSVFLEMYNTDPITRYTIFRIAFHLSCTALFLAGISITLVMKNLYSLTFFVGELARHSVTITDYLKEEKSSKEGKNSK